MDNSDSTSSHVANERSHAGLLRRGLNLEYVTLGWNVVGIFVAGVAALRAGSVALAGFGLDSLIEIFASVVVIWHLTESKGHNEKLALRLIGAAFLALAAYVIVQTAYIFIAGGRPATSVLGIAWLAVTVLAMLLLAWGKRVTGQQLDNPVLIAESRVTVIDAYLAGAVLVGVALNALLGWWCADPLSGLVIVYYAMIEGVAHWREGSKVTEQRLQKSPVLFDRAWCHKRAPDAVRVRTGAPHCDALENVYAKSEKRRYLYGLRLFKCFVEHRGGTKDTSRRIGS